MEVAGAAVASCDGDPTSRPRVLPPGFVARERELAEMVETLAHAGSTVVVEGEPGIGKSRMVCEVLACLPQPPASVLVGVCPPYRHPFTLGPVVTALRAGRASVRQLDLDGLAGALRPLFPEWRDDLPPLPEPMEDARAERHRLFCALSELLERLGVSLLVLEDLHWADEATLEFLLQLASEPHATVSLLLTYRPGDAPGNSLLSRLTSRMTAGPSRCRVRLEPLDVHGTTALVSSMLGDHPLSAHFADYLHGRTEGVPLAVEESVRLLSDRACLERRAGAWDCRSEVDLDVPPLVRDSVLERARSLSPDAQSVLRSAAVLSDPVDVDTILTVCDLGIPRGKRAVADAVASGLLGENVSGLVAFHHALAAKAVYDSIAALDRRELHRRAGHALTGTHPAPVARLVSHFSEAHDLGNWALYAELAADRAIAAGDDSTGVRLLTELVDAEELPLRTRLRLAKRLAGIEVFRRSVDICVVRKVVEALRRITETEGLAPREVADVRSPLGRLLMQMADFGAGRVELERAIPDLGHDPVESTRAMVYLGWPYGSSWHLSKHLDWLRRSEETEPATISDVDRLTLQVDRMTSRLLLGDESGWETAARLPVSVSSVKEGLEATRGHGNAGATAMLWGRYAAARRHLTTALALADAGRFERVHDPILAAAAHLDWFTGQWHGLADRVATIGSDDGERLPQLEAILVCRLLDVAGGHVGAAEKRLVDLLGEVEAQCVPDLFVMVAAALASVRLRQGRYDDALAVTDHPMSEVTRKGAWVWASEIAPLRVEAMVGQGRVEEERWLSTAFARGVHGIAAPAAAAAVKLCQALLVQARGDDPLAVARRYRDVAETWARLPRPFDAALASERHARCLLSAGRPDEALPLLVRVRQSLVDLGAVADAERVVATLRSHGVEVRGVQRGGRRPYGDTLSPRELDVVRLLVNGLTNRQIAQLLFLSPKTVARHLESARRKLGAGSRTVLAVKAMEAGILPGEPPPRPGSPPDERPARVSVGPR